MTIRVRLNPRQGGITTIGRAAEKPKAERAYEPRPRCEVCYQTRSVTTDEHGITACAVCREMARRPIPHGTLTAYYNGCDCDLCKTNHAYRTAIYKQVHDAMRAGDLLPEPCETCGDVERVEAHHDDYAKPLEIRWLCFNHHAQWHGHNKPLNASLIEVAS